MPSITCVPLVPPAVATIVFEVVPVVNVVVVVPAIVVIVAVLTPVVKPLVTIETIQLINVAIRPASRELPTSVVVVGKTCVTVACNGLATVVPTTTFCTSELT